MTTLKGMTWDHSRGYDPMIATSKNFAERYNNEVSIKWDKRSLQAFADRPIEQMVEEYDLMVIGSNLTGSNRILQCQCPLFFAGRFASRRFSPLSMLGIMLGGW